MAQNKESLKAYFQKVVSERLDQGDYMIYLEGQLGPRDVLVGSEELTGSFLNAAFSYDDGVAAGIVAFKVDQKEAAENFAIKARTMPKYTLIEGPQTI